MRLNRTKELGNVKVYVLGAECVYEIHSVSVYETLTVVELLEELTSQTFG